MRNPFAKPESVARHIKIAVTGKPGTGKTVFGLAAQSHGLGKVAVVSNEAGDVHYIKHEKWGGFDRLPTQKIEQLEEAINYIESSPGEYGTFVIDTVTGVYESLVSAAAKADGSVNVKSWGLIKRRWRSIMARINNLPANIVAVVHENDISETDDKTGKTTIVGQKLDAEKTFERNPDVLIRLGVMNGRRFARIIKDRTGTFQAGEVVEEPHIGMWAKAIKEGKHEARISTPEEVDADNEAALGRGTAPAAQPVTEASVPVASVESRLLSDCASGWSDWEAKRAWSKEHKAEKDSLPEEAQERVRVAFVNASPKAASTTKSAATPAA